MVTDPRPRCPFGIWIAESLLILAGMLVVVAIVGISAL